MLARSLVIALACSATFIFSPSFLNAQSSVGIKPLQVNIQVSNLNKSIAWYRDMLGFELVEKFSKTQPKAQSALLHLDGFYIELDKQENSCATSSLTLPEATEICGFCKVGFHVTGFEKYHQQVKQLHPDQVTDIITSEFSGSVYFCMYDPDQTLIQIFPASGSSDPITITPYLIGVTVKDMDAELSWYEENLGFAFIQKWDVPASNLYVRLLISGGFVVELRKEKPNFISRTDLEMPAGKTELLGIHHITFRIDDLQAHSDLLKSNHVTPVQEITPSTVSRFDSFMLVCDAEKNLLQIVQ